MGITWLITGENTSEDNDEDAKLVCNVVGVCAI